MKICLHNPASSLTVDLSGGAITDFHLKDEACINPLSFEFSKDQMPVNNKTGAPYRGHFFCVGRWGLPSEGEIKSGIPNHGEIANIGWTKKENSNEKLIMEATANKADLNEYCAKAASRNRETPATMILRSVLWTSTIVSAKM